MRNIIIDSFDLDDTPKPLAGAKVIATVTLIAMTAAKDGTGITLGGGAKEAELLPGIPVRFERVDLSQLSASGKSGDTLSMFGHSVD